MPSPEILPDPVDPDNVTEKEYRSSIETLQKFLNIKSANIQSVSDLSSATRGVGSSIRNLIIANGEVQTNRFYLIDGEQKNLRSIWRGWVLRTQNRDHMVYASFNERYSYVSTYYLVENTIHTIVNAKIPNYKRLFDCLGPVEELDTQAVDFRFTPTIDYYPLSHPTDIDQQQKYLQILQHATAELLEVIPLKNSIPDEFNF